MNQKNNSAVFMKNPNIQYIFAGNQGYSFRKMPDKVGMGIFFNGKLVARILLKNDFYDFLEHLNINWKQVISKKLKPNDVSRIIVGKTLFIIEFKYHQNEKYVYHELQTCDFKRKQYLQLVTPLGLKVEYVYVLNDWFKKPQYKDVLDYINSVNCHYKFDELPLAWLGLPTE